MSGADSSGHTLVPDPDRVVTEAIPADVIAARIAELGAAITEDYQDRRPIIVTVMTGALWFVSDLVKSMDIELELDFLMLNRFGEGGRIRIATDTSVSLTRRHVILVEDIVDTGLSLTVLHRLIQERQPASLATATLLDKVNRRLVDVSLDYRGFEVTDEYVVGYGLDHEGRYRNLPSIWTVLDMDAFRSDPEVLGRVAFEERAIRRSTYPTEPA